MIHRPRLIVPVRSQDERRFRSEYRRPSPRAQFLAKDRLIGVALENLLFNGHFAPAIGSGFPRYGWDVDPTGQSGYGTEWTLTRVISGAPSGHDAVQLDAVGQALGTDNETSGWYTKAWTMPVTQGTRWVARWRFMLVGAQSWRRALGDGTQANSIKSMIVGDPGEHAPLQPTRCITTMQAGAPLDYDDPKILSCQNIGPCGAEIGSLAINTWHHVQVDLQSGSTGVATDGFVDMYLNNNTFGSPTTTTGLIQLKTDGWSTAIESGVGLLRFGFGTFRSQLTGHTMSMRFADFELDTVFNAAWAL